MPPFYKELECTGYCSCGYCCDWEWGMILPGPFYLGFSPKGFPMRLQGRKIGHIDKKLPLISRYWTATELIGAPYYGFTSNGSVPAQARPPILSKDALLQYQKLPGRLLLPWRLFPRHGTIAADTNFYPFGTCMHIPGYGWGEVEDRGGAIVGPDKIDLYHCSHNEALRWGRKKLQVEILVRLQATFAASFHSIMDK
ncbi:uncharacterized protein LOC143890486 isoform X2 [Tasmannia lanceolata]|uniref:uncharacterized protein LOC143890486 isoform X2 n=1 Tax=Tasmannia lanceolata TaxID=3420 RepID=UPI004064B890